MPGAAHLIIMGSMVMGNRRMLKRDSDTKAWRVTWDANHLKEMVWEWERKQERKKERE